MITTTHATTFRRGEAADSFAVFTIFQQALVDLRRRLGFSDEEPPDAETLAQRWPGQRDLYAFLAETAAGFWVAEQDGNIVGYARATVCDGVQELTEFFVRPGAQSAGIGRELLRRAFPEGQAQHRVIIATSDMRAQARYLKSGVYPRFPIYHFWREAQAADVASDLAFAPISATADALAALGEIDAAVIGHRREPVHRWLLGKRQGYLYRRDGRTVGYGYVGHNSGPFALEDAADFPAVLAHAERLTAAAGHDRFDVEAPMINATAVDYLLARGFRIDPFYAFFMSDAPFGRFENYLVTSPPFFL